MSSSVSRSSFRSAYFLLNTRNSLALVGKVSIWREELNKTLFNSNILTTTFDKRFVGISEYMSYLSKSELEFRQIGLITKGTTNLAAVYYKDLRTLIFFVYHPPSE